MQTFLPYKNFMASAAALDNRRLNKQILEGYQVLNTLSGRSFGWRNHPAVKMWEGFERALYGYVQTMVDEAKRRGIKTDKNESNIEALRKDFWDLWGSEVPSWFQKEHLDKIMITHRANLYKKDPEFYIEFRNAVNDPNNKPCCPTCNYFWVTHLDRITTS